MFLHSWASEPLGCIHLGYHERCCSEHSCPHILWTQLWFLLGIFLGVDFILLPQHFPKWLHHFTIPPTYYLKSLNIKIQTIQTPILKVTSETPILTNLRLSLKIPEPWQKHWLPLRNLCCAWLWQAPPTVTTGGLGSTAPWWTPNSLSMRGRVHPCVPTTPHHTCSSCGYVYKLDAYRSSPPQVGWYSLESDCISAL